MEEAIAKPLDKRNEKRKMAAGLGDKEELWLQRQERRRNQERAHYMRLVRAALMSPRALALQKTCYFWLFGLAVLVGIRRLLGGP